LELEQAKLKVIALGVGKGEEFTVEHDKDDLESDLNETRQRGEGNVSERVNDLEKGSVRLGRHNGRFGCAGSLPPLTKCTRTAAPVATKRSSRDRTPNLSSMVVYIIVTDVRRAGVKGLKFVMIKMRG
jgi:hypothetical protein